MTVFHTHFMSFMDHSPKSLIVFLKTIITHQSHYRKGKSVKYFMILYDRIASLSTHQFPHSKLHVLIIISDHNNIMGIMGYTGRNCSTTDTKTSDHATADFPRHLMTFYNCNLLIIVIGLEFAGTIPCFQSSLSGSNLSFFCQNHRKDSICRLQLKCLSGKFSHMHCIFQFRGTRLYNNLCIFIYQLPFKVHIFYGHTDKIRKNQKICLSAGCHCPLVFQSITISCIDGCHLNSGHRIHAKADSFSHVMVNMPFPLDILNMLVICAKAESVTIHVSLYQTAHKCLKISGSTAFPYENGKAVPPFSHCIIKEAALMVRSNPCHGICLKIPLFQKRSVAITDSAFKQLQLVMHAFLALYHRNAVHYFSKSKNPAVMKVRSHIFSSKSASIIINGSSRNTGWHHHIYICFHIFGLIQNIINSCQTGHIG